MGIFDDLDQSDAFDNSKYFQEGRYVVKIHACKLREGHKGTTFIVEATVLGVASEHPNAPQPGERAAHVWKASGSPEKIEMGRGTWMGFLCAAFGVQKGAYDGPTWKTISAQVLDDNYLKDQVFGLECHMKKTREGNDFTVHSWRGPQSAEQLATFGLAPDGSAGA